MTEAYEGSSYLVKQIMIMGGSANVAWLLLTVG